MLYFCLKQEIWTFITFENAIRTLIFNFHDIIEKAQILVVGHFFQFINLKILMDAIVVMYIHISIGKFIRMYKVDLSINPTPLKMDIARIAKIARI